MYLSKITHNPKVLKRYSQFENKLELKQSVRQHIKKIKAQDMRADRKQGLIDVTMLLFSMSQKIVGVSWMSYKTMAKRLNVSDKTIQRRIDQLVELGIIGKMSARRSTDKMRTSNVLYFIKCPIPNVNYYLRNNKHNKNHIKQKQTKFANMVPVAIRDYVTHVFKTGDAIKGFLNIRDYWTKQKRYKLTDTQLNAAIIKALKKVMSTQNVRNPLGLFNHAFSDILVNNHQPVDIEKPVNAHKSFYDWTSNAPKASTHKIYNWLTGEMISI